MVPQKIKFYPDTQDDMWNKECEKLMPYLNGKGIDIGSGDRCILTESCRVDIDKNREPHFCCSGDELPCEDEEFDFLTSIHSLEHFEDPEKTLREWRRIVKKGGIVAIVHPDVDYTKKQLPEDANPDKNPHNKHFYERNHEGFIKWFESLENVGLKIIDTGPACREWSFYVILKRVIAFK